MHSGPILKKSNILKSEDEIQVGNIIFIRKSITISYGQFSKIDLYYVQRFKTMTHRELIIISAINYSDNSQRVLGVSYVIFFANQN